MAKDHTQNNYQVISPDMLGFGDSPTLPKKSDNTIDLIITDLVQIPNLFY